MTDQLGLDFDAYPGDPLAQKRLAQFLEYHRANPQVFELFERFALEGAARRERFSSDAIVHRIRWYTAVETNDPEGYRVNDRWTSFYVRLFLRKHPELRDFFELRKSIADRAV